MQPLHILVASRLLLVALTFAAMGCQDGMFSFSKRDIPPEPPPPPRQASSAALIDTVGAEALLAGMGGLAVRGFGIVIGLGDKGSTESPPAIREYVADALNRNYKSSSTASLGADFSVNALIDSPDSALVEVLGIIPPAAPSGSRFDILVEAVSGTQTRSLEAGLLLPCELKIVDVAYTGDKLIAGRTVATAAGPIFVNPPGRVPNNESPNPRRGAVLGGGRSKERRNVRLTLNSPSYATARRIEQRINARFGSSPKVAEAMSRGYVEIRTPAGYEDDPPRFVKLITRLFMFDEPDFVEKKLNDLAALVERGNPAAYEDISLAWEAIGKIAIPRVQPFYGHADPAVSYYAARAGLRLGDASALPIVARVAADSGHVFRREAIEELGWCRFQQAGGFLAPLLGEKNSEIRVAAYDALLRQKHPAIQSRRIPFALDARQDNFWLDVIDSPGGEPMIYVRRTTIPRIAVFGGSIPCRVPLFYAHADDAVTLNAVEAAGDITMFCRTKRTKRLSDTLSVPPRAVDLIRTMADVPLIDETGRTRGLGLAYSQVVAVLDALCKDETIPANLVFQPWSMTELIEPELTPERPESDEPRRDEIPSTTPADDPIDTGEATPRADG